MLEQKLNNLQRFVQSQADTAWAMSNKNSKYSSLSSKTFGQQLELQLQLNNNKLDKLLNEIALEQLQQEDTTPDPPDFSQYIRYSTAYMDNKEVFVGDKWVIVPYDACVEFMPTTMYNNTRGFTVTISHENNYATFTSSENLQSYNEQQDLLNTTSDGQISVTLENNYVSKEEFDWKRLGGKVYGETKDLVGFLDSKRTLYNDGLSKKMKRKYAYKLSKQSAKIGKPIKSGKIYQGAKKLVKKTKALGPIGNALTIGSIGYEVSTDTWDAHTVVDGTLLVVGVAATALGAPVVVIGIAVYGILDYAFGINDMIDKHIGRKSGIWGNSPIENFPREATPLFNEVKIDNTRVKTRKIPSDFKLKKPKEPEFTPPVFTQGSRFKH